MQAWAIMAQVKWLISDFHGVRFTPHLRWQNKTAYHTYLHPHHFHQQVPPIISSRTPLRYLPLITLVTNRQPTYPMAQLDSRSRMCLRTKVLERCFFFSFVSHVITLSGSE